MVGRFFGSSSSPSPSLTSSSNSGIGGVPATSLNTPKGSSSLSNGATAGAPSTQSSSRRERIEQARKDRTSRRRNFAFLKTSSSSGGSFRGGSGNGGSSGGGSSLTKRREHAKQLANLAYSEHPSLANGGGGDGGTVNTPSSSTTMTPTNNSSSTYARQQLLSTTTTTSGWGVDAPSSPDPFAGTAVAKTKLQSAEPSASTVDTWDTTSVGSASMPAFDMDFIAATSTTGRNSTGGGGGGGGGMKTFPSNSTMQATQYMQQPRNRAVVQPSASFASTGGASSITTASTMQNTPQRQKQQQAVSDTPGSRSGSIGAAARRRMRSRMRHSDNNVNNSSNASVGSEESGSQSFSSSTNHQYFDPHSTTISTATTPESPVSTYSRSASVHSVGSASKNRLAAYQQRNGGGSNTNLHASFQSSGGGGGSVASSGANSGASPNLFDPDNLDGGFTFDAFGLDQSQVERDVNRAMQELAGQGVSGFSFLVSTQQQEANSKDTANSRGISSINNSNNMFRNDSFGMSDDDSFAPHHAWDTGSNASRNTSPVPPHDGDGFENGFKVRQPQQQQQNNPAATTAPISASARRLQRSMRRGTTTTTGSAGDTSAQTKKTIEPLTPPRWEDALSSARVAAASPNTAAAAFNDQVVKNPWSEDPWASDNSGGGGGSDFGGTTLSEVQDYRGSYGSAGADGGGRRRRDYSDAKSDVGGSRRPSSVRSHIQSFYQLPPEEPRPKGHLGGPVFTDGDTGEDSDHSDEMSQMQEEFANEFARDLIERVSPRKENSFLDRSRVTSRQQPTQRVLDYGEDSEIFRRQQEEMEDPHSMTQDKYTLRESSEPRSAPTSHGSVTTRRKIGSFRSKYESSRSEVSLPSSGNNVDKDISPREFAESPKVVSEALDDEKTESPARRPSYNPTKLGTSLAPQSSAAAPPRWNRPTKAQEVEVETFGEDDADRSEEKKEDESPAARSASFGPSVPKVGSLKARWEAQTRTQTVSAKPPIVEPSRPNVSEKARQSIGVMDNSFEMLTPDIVEARRQEKQKERLQNLRKSMGVVDSPDKKGSLAKSDAGGSRFGGSATERVLDRIRRESPRSMDSAGNRDETKSDGGSTPSFLANVKLRKVANPEPVHTPTEDVACGLDSQSLSHPQEAMDRHAETSTQPVGKKLTYRERRELELKREKEEMAKLEATKAPASNKDVASLIRRRIAANKQKTVVDRKETGASSLSSIRGRLKPLEKENISQGESLSNSLTISREQPSLRNGPSPRLTTQLISPRNESPSVRSNKSQFTPTAVAEDAIAADYPHAHLPSPEQRQKSPRVGITVAPTTSPGIGNDEIQEAPHRRDDDKAKAVSPRYSSPSKSVSPKSSAERLLASRHECLSPATEDATPPPKPDVRQKVEVPDEVSPADVKSMLSSFLGSRALSALPLPAKEDDTVALRKHHVKSPTDLSPSKKEKEETAPPPPPPATYTDPGNRPALKDDPKFERYFRMLKMGLPLEVAKHAMDRDGLDPSILDHDHNKPVGVPLKEDPKFEKYFKMLKIGIAINQVKHAMERDGLNPDIMDQDHSLPVITVEKKHEKKEKETHRRARLHWKTIKKVVRNSLWAKVETEIDGIDIDEEEFNDLFKADLQGSTSVKTTIYNKKKGAAVRVIDAKRANNGGIILARLKMTHDEMADAVDRIDSDALSAEQIENIIEYLPTKEEREALEKYMLEGGQDAAEKFDGLCECEKFMVSMMTVKHAKRKIRALLFKLQFMSCMESIAEDAQTIDNACDELSQSNRLRQLLGIILHFGNRLNTAGVHSKNKAGAFTLDSLSKLSQAKAFDKKTTFLHYIVLIVQRNNELLLKYYDDIPTVLKADKVFWDQCLQDLEEVENQLENVRRISLYEAKMKKQFQLQRGKKDDDEDSLDDMQLSLEEEVQSLRATSTGLFTLGAIKQVSALRDKIDRTKAKFTRVLEYFGEDKKNLQPHDLFHTITSFTRDFQKAKEEVFTTVSKRLREDRKKARNQTPNQKKCLPPAGPDRSASKPMKASDHQPNMSKLFSDIQRRDSPASERSTTSGSNTSPSNRMSSQDALMKSLNRVQGDKGTSNSSPSFRNFHHPSRIPEETTAPSPEDEGGQSARPVSIALAPTTSLRTTLMETTSSPPIRSPREALRNRRRIEAMRANGTTRTSPV